MEASIVHNEGLPVSRLPSELLSTIFLLSQAWEARLFAVVVSHVCRSWRAVALTTPLLWNTIQLLGHWSISMLEAYLIRSRTCYLNIFIHIETRSIHQSMDLLIVHSERWRRFHVYAVANITDVLSGYLREAATPLLEDISLYIEEDSLDYLPHLRFPEICPQILTRSKPPLKSVHLGEILLNGLQPPLTNITTLDLKMYNFEMDIEPTQFIHFFKELHFLVNLSLHILAFSQSESSYTAIKPVTLPHLRTLRIVDSYPEIHQFFSLLVFPFLETLILHDTLQFDLCALPSVKHVTINLSDTMAFPHICQSCPSVTDLTIVLNGSLFYPMLTPSHTHPEETFWPLLRKVRLIHALDCDDPELLCNMLSTRAALGHALQELLVDGKSWTFLEIIGWADELESHVVVKRCDDPDPWSAVLGYYTRIISDDSETRFIFDDFDG